MGKRECRRCAAYKECKDSTVSWIFFIVGLIATVSVRLGAIFIGTNDFYARLSWYVGVVGFFLFFLYKFDIERRRGRIIKEAALEERVRTGGPLAAGDYETIGAILCSLSSNKDRINYFFIFATSVITLSLAVWLDFIRPMLR